MKSTLLIALFLCLSFLQAQPPNDGFYMDALESDLFKIPNSDQINHITINNRTYETYFKANEVTSRQMIFMEGSDKRQIMAYLEGGYLIVGAHNIDTGDYLPVWGGTFFRKPVSANTWYHLALVFDNAQPTVSDPISVTDNTAFKFYLDGVLQDEKAGFQIGGSGNHNELVVGAKDNKLWFPTCSTWTASGLSEYCFQDTLNEDGGGENFFDGYIWGFRVWNEARTATQINNKMKQLIFIDEGNLLAVLDGDTITYLDNNSVATDEENNNPSVLRVWEGNQSIDWNDPLNWKNGIVPDDAKQERVFISKGQVFYPEISTVVTVGDLSLEDNTTSITIKSGGLLDVAYDMINEGTLTIEDNGSFNLRESKPVAGLGTYTIVRNSPDYTQADLYSIWSTPVSQPESQLNTIFDHAIITYIYDASLNPAQYVYVPSTETMEVGRGYFIRPDNVSGVTTNTFSGQINQGKITEPVYFNGGTDNWNLLGNPYASPLNWFSFQEENSDLLEGTVYFWNHTQTNPNSSSDYISLNTTGSNPPGATEFIGTAQGFFVEAKQAGSVTFKNSQRSAGSNDQFYKTNTDSYTGRSWFKLMGNDEYSSILVGFVPGANDNVDSDFDSKFIDEGDILSFYSLIDNEKYTIQGRSVLETGDNVIIPLGYNLSSIGNYTITIDQEFIDPDFDIILEDLHLNVQTDLRSGDYQFTSAVPGEINDRFVLKFYQSETLGTDEPGISGHEIKVYFQGDYLVSINQSKINPKTINLCNMKGKQLYFGEFNESLKTNNLGSGIYLVTFGFDDYYSITKKIYKE